MRCALSCIEYLSKYYHFDVEGLIIDLEDKLTDKGISIYDLLTISSHYGLQLKAFKGLLLPKQLPIIVYLHHFRRGHYMVIDKRTWFSFYLFDGVDTYRKVSKIWFYFFYSRIYILCYNSNK